MAATWLILPHILFYIKEFPLSCNNLYPFIPFTDGNKNWPCY